MERAKQQIARTRSAMRWPTVDRHASAAGQSRGRLTGIAACALAGTLLLGGCDTFFGDGPGEPLPGERFSVLELEQEIAPDPQIADIEVVLPTQFVNLDWPQAGGLPTHAVGHPALELPFREAWSVDIGAGSSGARRLISQPVVAVGTVFAMDANGRVTAFDAQTGERQWRVVAASPDEDSYPLGGGLAFANGRLFVSTGFGEVLSLDPTNGGLIWRAVVGGPVRAAPTVDSGRVFVVTVDNQLEVLDSETGLVLWTHTGILETAGLLGGASPAAGNGIVLVPYSSGEVFALRIDSGRTVWSDSLTAIRRVGALASLADIRGMPVLDDDLAFVASHSGRMVAIDLRSGIRAWEQDIGSIQTPWVAGDFVFVLTTNNEVVALTRRTGRIRWVQTLPRWRNPELRTGPIVWSGPLLAGGFLIVVGSEGLGVLLSPTTGEPVARLDLEDDAEVAPIIANRTLYVLADDGTLTAYR